MAGPDPVRPERKHSPAHLGFVQRVLDLRERAEVAGPGGREAKARILGGREDILRQAFESYRTMDGSLAGDLGTLGYEIAFVEGIRPGDSVHRAFDLTAWRSGFGDGDRGYPYGRVVIFGFDQPDEGDPACLSVFVRTGEGPLLHARILPNGNGRSAAYDVRVTPLVSWGGSWVAAERFIKGADPVERRPVRDLPLVAAPVRWRVPVRQEWPFPASGAVGLSAPIGDLVMGMVETMEDASLFAPATPRYGMDGFLGRLLQAAWVAVPARA